jgi:hypothetical protein
MTFMANMNPSFVEVLSTGMNKIAQTKSDKQMSLSFDHGTLLLTNMVRKELADVIGSSVWRWDSRVGAWRCAAIHYAVVRNALFGRCGARFSDEVMKPAGISWPKIDMPKLRSEQAEALAAWSQAGCRGQIIMPTGTGKTKVALEQAKNLTAISASQDFDCCAGKVSARWCWHR